MRPSDIAALLQTLAGDVREFVSHAVDPIQAKHAALEQRVAALAAEKAEPGPPGASAFETALDAGFIGTEKEWLDSLRGPAGESIRGERGERGADGASVTLEDLEPLVAKAVVAFPPPRDGKSVTPDDVRPMLHELVDAAVSALPPPASGQDGASVTLEDVQPIVDKAVAALPLPSVEDVRPIVQALVDAAAAAIPRPRDGQDGKSFTLDDVQPLVDAAVAGLPPTKSLTPEDMRPLLQELVYAAAADIPIPADGLSVSLDDVRPLVERAVAEAHAQAFGAEDVHPLVVEQLRGFASALTAKFASADNAC